MAASPQHRDLVADFLLVKTGETGWTAFRDVFELNRVAVRDRDDRLAKLFMASPGAAVAEAEAINRESARYNIGPRRTINNPLLALAFLQDRYRSQFSFSLDSQDRIDGTDVSIVKYEEGVSPTLIRGLAGADVPARGRYWIDPQTGRILQTEITTNDGSVRSEITVTFRFDERFGVCVPVQMDEQYFLRNGGSTRATARYDRFRRFEVKTEEQAR